MPFKAIPKEIKEQILTRVKSGVPVLQLSEEHGIHKKTIYGWLSKQTGSKPSNLTIGRWKREKQDLLNLVGELSYKLKKMEKNKHYK